MGWRSLSSPTQGNSEKVSTLPLWGNICTSLSECFGEESTRQLILTGSLLSVRHVTYIFSSKLHLLYVHNYYLHFSDEESGCNAHKRWKWDDSICLTAKPPILRDGCSKPKSKREVAGSMAITLSSWVTNWSCFHSRLISALFQVSGLFCLFSAALASVRVTGFCHFIC